MNKKEVKKAPTLRFKGFTNDWEQRKLGEISNIIAGGDKNINKIKKYGKYPVIANSINKNGIVGYYDNEYRVKAPAVTVTGRGEIGHAVARFQNFTPIVRLLALSSKLDSIFLANSINKIRFFNESTGVPQLTKPQLSTYSIIIPSVEEQNNIGKLILLIEKYIHLQQRKNCLTKKIVSALSKQLTNPQFIIKCQNTQVPKKHNVLLKEIINYKNGKSHEKNQKNTGQFELVNLNSISKSGKLKTSGKYVNDTEECLKKGDIVMILSDIARGQLIGLTAVIPKDKYYVLNQRIALLHPIKKLNSVFLSSYLNNQQQYFKRVAAGMSQINISKKDVENFKLRIPDLSTQNFFGTIINQLNNFIDNNQNKSKQLIVFKEFLLQNMFI